MLWLLLGNNVIGINVLSCLSYSCLVFSSYCTIYQLFFAFLSNLKQRWASIKWICINEKQNNIFEIGIFYGNYTFNKKKIIIDSTNILYREGFYKFCLCSNLKFTILIILNFLQKLQPNKEIYKWWDFKWRGCKSYHL